MGDHTLLALQLKASACVCGSPVGASGEGAILTGSEQLDDDAREEKDPPSRDRPVSIMRTEMLSQARKVRSLAKNVLGSTLDLTIAFDLQQPPESMEEQCKVAEL